ncbi:hypothetical protein NHX12_019151 [Muraenolepis orangiensis]|uniref:Transforming acidic coiled-coil-containing protein C-terminal domain-containing protein n=1 Tax=Muraenolepis orangiensis TaxID=630683 RepID=A0A9Q0IVS9_9TELE|nr:hypothetical protein NHX12_019151 [Muraenolepis orangiensis]
MSSVPVNDENRGVSPGGKHNSSFDDMFAIEQPTGRQSILRQTENLPNKTLPKGGKVSFNTPRRDPVTNRLLSPSKFVKMESLDECIKAMDSLRLVSSTSTQEGTETVGVQDNEDAPLPARAYCLDFDNLDAIDPFQTESCKMLNSPVLRNQPAVSPVKKTHPENIVDVPKVKPSPENIVDVPKAEKEAPIQTEAEPTITARGAYSLDFDTLDAIDPFQTKSCKMLNSPVKKTHPENIVDVPKVVTEAPIQPESSKMLNSPVLGNQLPANQLPGNQPAISPVKKPNPENIVDVPKVVTEALIQPESSKMLNSPVLGNQLPANQLPGNQPAISPVKKPNPENIVDVPKVVTEALIQPESSKMLNSPVLGNQLPANQLPGNQPAISPVKKPNPENIVDVPKVVTEAPIQPESSKMLNSPVLGNQLPANQLPGNQPAVSPVKKPNPKNIVDVPKAEKEAPIQTEADPTITARGAYSLDFDNFDAINPFQTGGSKMLNSPLRNQTAVSPVKKSNPENIIDVTKAVKGASIQPEAKPMATVAPNSNKLTNAPDSEAMVKPAGSPAKGGPIKLEFNFDDGAEVKRKPPPKKFGKRPPTAKASAKKPAPEKQPEPAQEPTIVVTGNDVYVETPLPKVAYSYDFDNLDDPNFNPFGTNVKLDDQCGVKSSPAGKVEPPAVKKMVVPELMCNQVENQALSPCAGGDVTSTEASTAHGEIPQQEEPMSVPDLGRRVPGDLSQQYNSEEFVPGTTFIASDFDGQMDYLEQFGSANFKESALRKQSLYLKFDPLMRESPKKAGAPAIVEPLIQNATMLESLVPPTNAEEAIIEVLKYSQEDMDAAIARVRAEAKEKEEEFNLKYEKRYEDGQEMRKIIDEFERAIAKIVADSEKEKTVAQVKLNKVLMEKEQVSMDLNAMEGSFSELFKRLEKYKGVLEAFKKNEQTLKGCAQEYLNRIKKEEQRYQTLKAHAEEKITKANEEVAEVRSKLKAEVSALNVQLRREQLKSQSLEKNYNQKVKEAEELNNLCDELIAKVQTG